MNTYHNHKGTVQTDHKNEYSYEAEDNKLLSFFIWTFTVILVVSIIALASTITVKADSIGYADYVYSVPTALCYDPLLGMSFVIYTDCSVGTEDHKDNDDLHGVNVIIPDTDDSIVPSDNTEVIITPDNDDIPVTDDNTPIDDTGNDSKGNNGHGNNTDGCDSSNPSGKCPNKGNDDSAPIDDEKKSK